MSSNFEMSETGNWNIAQNWTNDMIFKPFYEVGQYLTIAFFGCSSIEEDFMFDEETKTRSKIRALKWARHKMEMGVRQCLFAIRNTNDKKKLSEYLDSIVELKKYFPLIENKVFDRDTCRIAINEEAFNKVYEVLTKIFTEITEPMNRSELIFMYKEQFDPKLAKARIKEELINIG